MTSTPSIAKVSNVRQEFETLLTAWDEIGASQDPANSDIDCEDIRAELPFERIEKAIERNLQAPSPMPKYDDLVNEPKNSGLSVFTPTLGKRKSMRPPQNYLPESRVEAEHEGFWQVDAREVLITISLYHSEKDAKMAQYMVLGSQTLTALRDRMYCLAHHILDGPETRSSFMFIENTFYNDMRSPKAMDYSRIIMEWANEHERYQHPGVGMGMTAKRMEEVKFEELSIALGAQYLLCHQGSCEHVMVFDELRLLQPDDVQNQKAYPLQLFEGHNVRKCTICKIHSAKKVTYGDRLAPETPCFLCESCYHQMHYTKDESGKYWQILYDDYEVYPYFHE